MSELCLDEHVPDDAARFTRFVGPEPNDVLVEMEAYADSEGFPIVGPAVGGWLCHLADNTMSAGRKEPNRIGADPDFETTLQPLGDGVTVSTRIR